MKRLTSRFLNNKKNIFITYLLISTLNLRSRTKLCDKLCHCISRMNEGYLTKENISFLKFLSHAVISSKRMDKH